MIKKIYKADPILSSECEGEMQIIFFLTDWVVDRIIKHLQLSLTAQRSPLLKI